MLIDRRVAYGLLAATAAVVAALRIFATHRLRLARLVIAPVVFFNVDYVLHDLALLPDSGFHGTRRALDAVKLPLISALFGWGLGSSARATLNRRSTAVETAAP
ncbi:MAG TPA: hypothetical protein VMM15_34130 [Bradyrhizobium sp.]|nr:hypothetical protein [Bradyrhizobium sp.]